VGFSLGGALATLLASEEAVDRLVLAAPFYRVTYKFYYVLPASTWHAIVAPFVRYTVKGKSLVKVNREEARSKLYSYQVVPVDSVDMLWELSEAAGSAEVLERIECPVLMLHAEGDEAASPDAALEAFDLLGSEYKTFLLYDRSNHHLFWDYDREEVKHSIADFLALPAARDPDQEPRGG
ncbi:MAG: alpha/beta hydrolase, partial [Planctomycetota bacterium]